MKIIYSTIGNVVYEYGKTVETGVFPEADPDRELYKLISEDGQVSYFMPDGLSITEVESIPDDYASLQYCYTDSEGWYKNPNWVEPPESNEERLDNLEDYSAELLYQVSLLQLGITDDEIETEE